MKLPKYFFSIFNSKTFDYAEPEFYFTSYDLTKFWPKSQILNLNLSESRSKSDISIVRILKI